MTRVLEGFRVLIVDDDLQAADQTGSALLPYGATVTTSTSSAAVALFARGCCSDVVIANVEPGALAAVAKMREHVPHGWRWLALSDRDDPVYRLVATQGGAARVPLSAAGRRRVGRTSCDPVHDTAWPSSTSSPRWVYSSNNPEAGAR